MQESIVVILFVGVIALFAYRYRKRRKADSGCAHCEFNEDRIG